MVDNNKVDSLTKYLDRSLDFDITVSDIDIDRVGHK